jgi:hypothetical protein
MLFKTIINGDANLKQKVYTNKIFQRFFLVFLFGVYFLFFKQLILN